MMNRNLLGVYSLIVLLLFGVGLYRSLTGPDPGPPPDVEIELSREGANPGSLKEPEGSKEQKTDFDGDDPAPTDYSYSKQIGSSAYIYGGEMAMELSSSDYLESPYYTSILKMAEADREQQRHNGDRELGRRWVYQGVHH